MGRSTRRRRSTATPARCWSTAPATRRSPAPSTTAAGNLPNLVIDKPSGTLTLAGTIRTAHNWTYTAGTVDPGTSTVVYAGNLAVSGSHTLHDLTIATGTIAVAAGTTVTVTGALTLTDGNHRDRHGRRPGSDQPGGHVRPGHRHAAHQRHGRPDLHRCLDGRGGQPSGGRHRQAIGHAHPGRHDPDRPELDVHRGDPRRGDLDGRLRGQPRGERQPQPGQPRHRHGDDHRRRRHDRERARDADPDRRDHQYRHGGRRRARSRRLPASTRAPGPCSSTARSTRPSRAPRPWSWAASPTWSSTSRRARSPWPARSGPGATGRTPRGRSTRAPRRSCSPATLTLTGSHTLHDVVFNGAASPTRSPPAPRSRWRAPSP